MTLVPKGMMTIKYRFFLRSKTNAEFPSKMLSEEKAFRIEDLREDGVMFVVLDSFTKLKAAKWNAAGWQIHKMQTLRNSNASIIAEYVFIKE